MMTYTIAWLTGKFDRGETIKYIFFWGHTAKNSEEAGKFVFSQWYPSPFTVENVVYKTSEHWMMAQKAKLFGDDEAFQRILQAEQPGAAKEIGRAIKNFDEQRWIEKRYDIVKTGNIHKFGQHKDLKDYLLTTGDRILVEASPRDAVWGIGLTQDAHGIENPHTWKGLNLLGFALMEARDHLKGHAQ